MSPQSDFYFCVFVQVLEYYENKRNDQGTIILIIQELRHIPSIYNKNRNQRYQLQVCLCIDLPTRFTFSVNKYRNTRYFILAIFNLYVNAIWEFSQTSLHTFATARTRNNFLKRYRMQLLEYFITAFFTAGVSGLIIYTNLPQKNAP